MRAFAILLLVLNVAFFAWRYDADLQHHLETTVPVAPLPAETPSLTLLSELPQLPPLREAEHDAGPAPDQAALAAPAPPADGAPVSPAAAAQNPAPEAQPVQEEAAPAHLPAAPEAQAASAPASTPAPATNASAPQDLSTTAIGGDGAPSETCVSVGPFLRADDLVPLKRWILRRATSVHVATRTVHKRRLFWVYLEADSDTAARRKVADLEQKGVKDYLIIQRDGIKNAISLGLFSSQDSVNKRLAEISRQGYKPIVVPRIETTELYWLHARLATGAEDIHAIPKDLYGGAAATTIDCMRIDAPEPGTERPVPATKPSPGAS